MRFPMLYVVIPFSLGIIAQRETFIVGLIAVALVFILKLSYKAALISFALLGYIASFVTEHHQVMPYGNKLEMIASIEQIPQSKGRWQRTVANVISYKDSSGVWQDAESKVQLYVDTSKNIAIGQKITYTAKQFQIDSLYRTYYLNKGITGRVYVYDCHSISIDTSLLERVQIFSNSLSGRIAKIKTDSQNIALMQALTVGDKSGISKESRNAYNRTGAAHILAVSGLHVGIIFVMLSLLLGWLRLFRRGYLLYGSILILLLWLYAAVTGFSPSVLRAVVMFTLYQVGTMTLRSTNNLNTLAAAGFILLVLNPNYLFDIGFQLSFTAMVGIALFYKFLARLWWSPVWRVAAVTLAAQIAVLPLSCYYFGNVPLLGLFVNLALWAVVPTIIILVFGYLVTGLPILGEWAAWITCLQNNFVSWCSSHGWIAIEDIEFPLWGLLMIYLVIGIMVWLVWLVWYKDVAQLKIK